jgi:hypothetical protein
MRQVLKKCLVLALAFKIQRVWARHCVERLFQELETFLPV